MYVVMLMFEFIEFEVMDVLNDIDDYMCGFVLGVIIGIFVLI